MNIAIFIRAGLALAWLVSAAGASAQQEGGPVDRAGSEGRPVTLAEVRSEARTRGRGARAAEARAEAARNAERAVSSARWPTLGVSAGMVRSDDPVAAFGGRLRHAAFTQADFDPAALNNPDALTDWSAAAQAAWTPLDLARSAGIRAASADAAAAGAGAEWAGNAAEFGAVIAFLEAVASDERRAAAIAALRAAESNLTRVRRRVEEGVLTEADSLQAQASAQQARARVIDAERHMSDARDRLAYAIGWTEDVVPVLDQVALDAAFGELNSTGGDDGDLRSRPDLMASDLAVESAQERVAEASRSRLPRLDGFAVLSTHSADPFDGVRDTWTVGLQVSVPVFTGFAISSRERSARAMLDAARFEHDDRVESARIELESAIRAVESAEAHLAAATSARNAATEAARLMRRRFEEGLATVSDLLGVEAQAAALATAAIDARLGLHAARARVDFLSTETRSDRTRPAGM